MTAKKHPELCKQGMGGGGGGQQSQSEEVAGVGLIHMKFE